MYRSGSNLGAIDYWAETAVVGGSANRNANLRDSPGLDGDILIRVDVGQPLTVLNAQTGQEVNGDPMWFKVVYDYQGYGGGTYQGYMHNSVLDPVVAEQVYQIGGEDLVDDFSVLEDSNGQSPTIMQAKTDWQKLAIPALLVGGAYFAWRQADKIANKRYRR
tara:strand:+ start:920 stop:1405 length:486 start_codon:yes stop_codon:yes gene_type:complete